MALLRVMLTVFMTSVFVLIPAVDTQGAKSADSGPALKVLLVSEFKGDEAREIKKLLEEHNATVTVVRWRDAASGQARDFDLTIIGGTGRNVRRGKSALAFEGAVLGLGPYGCKYFGSLRLKNGHPYT